MGRTSKIDFPTAVAADAALFFDELRPGVGTDIWVLPSGGAPVAWLATPAEEERATLSPDGRLVAYSSPPRAVPRST